jgi:hypothetical protein
MTKEPTYEQVSKAEDMVDAYEDIEKQVKAIMSSIEEIGCEGLDDLYGCLEDGLNDIKRAKDPYERIISASQRAEEEWLRNASYRW